MHKIWQIALWTSLFKQESFFRFGKIFRWRYWRLAREKSKYKVYKRNNLGFWALKEWFVCLGFHNFRCDLNSINFLWQIKNYLYILKWRDNSIQIGKNSELFSLPQWLCCYESANTFQILDFVSFPFKNMLIQIGIFFKHILSLYWVQTVVNLIW